VDVVFIGALILLGVTLRLVTLKEMLEDARLDTPKRSPLLPPTR
jgi:hypothetical protein